MDFAEIIRGIKKKSEWIEWVSNSESKAATETLQFLSICYSNLPQSNKTKTTKRLQKGDQQEVEAIIHELITYEFLRRMELKPEWSPTIEGLTPDLLFKIKKEIFVADVFIVKSPKKTITSHGRIIESSDKYWIPSENRAKKIADIVDGKSTKYSKLHFPLILFIFLGDNLLLDNDKVEAALFGKTIKDILNDDKYPDDLANHHLHENLSAVIACKWFDTNNLSDEGKRLRCNIYHNWAAKDLLPTNTFSIFGQIFWEKDDNHEHPMYLGDQSIVVKFCGENGFEAKPYSYNAPW
jgi:hypothetical protein